MSIEICLSLFWGVAHLPAASYIPVIIRVSSLKVWLLEIMIPLGTPHGWQAKLRRSRSLRNSAQLGEQLTGSQKALNFLVEVREHAFLNCQLQWNIQPFTINNHLTGDEFFSVYLHFDRCSIETEYFFIRKHSQLLPICAFHNNGIMLCTSTY